MCADTGNSPQNARTHTHTCTLRPQPQSHALIPLRIRCRTISIQSAVPRTRHCGRARLAHSRRSHGCRLRCEGVAVRRVQWGRTDCGQIGQLSRYKCAIIEFDVYKFTFCRVYVCVSLLCLCVVFVAAGRDALGVAMTAEYSVAVSTVQRTTTIWGKLNFSVG